MKVMFVLQVLTLLEAFKVKDTGSASSVWRKQVKAGVLSRLICATESEMSNSVSGTLFKSIQLAAPVKMMLL